jgi:hypothetical protein
VAGHTPWEEIRHKKYFTLEDLQHHQIVSFFYGLLAGGAIVAAAFVVVLNWS